MKNTIVYQESGCIVEMGRSGLDGLFFMPTHNFIFYSLSISDFNVPTSQNSLQTNILLRYMSTY